MAKFQNDLTQGSVSKNLIKFSMPFLLSNFIQAIYSMADMFIVGKFNGPESISGVTIGSRLTMLITSLVLGLVTGGTIMVSQYLGANRKKDMQETIGTMFTLMLILAVLFTAVAIIFADFLLNAIHTPTESFGEAKSYFIICTTGIIFIFGYNAISAVLRGMGDSKNPLIFVSIAAVVNVFLDLLFVGVFNMKAGGAAFATVIAQALSMIISIVYLARSRFAFDFRPSSFKIHKDKLKQLLLIGLPTSLSNSISTISFLTLTTLVNDYGVYASTGVGVAGKVDSFAILPSVAMSTSIAAMAGQNIGAGHFDRAKQTMKVGRRIAVGIGAAIFCVIQLIPEAIIGIFTNDAASIAYGTQYMRSFSIDYLIAPFAFCTTGLITGSGHTLFVAFISILSAIVFRIPLAQILSIKMDLGLTGVALAVPIGSFCYFLMGLAFVQSGRWKENKITKPAVVSAAEEQTQEQYREVKEEA